MIVRKIILGIFILLSFQIEAQQQSFVRLTKEEVKERLNKDYRNFSMDKSVVKQQFNYLKYVNGSQTITWIFYFSDKDLCTSTKKVCDYAEYDFILAELNEQCEQVDDANWEFSDDDREFTFTLIEQDWYFTIREREKNNKK
jgi:hypothetical protein